MIPLALCSVPVGCVKKPSPLSTREPVSNPGTQLLRALHAPDARCEIGAEQAVVGSLVGQAAHCCQPQVDGRRSKPSGLQLISVPKNDCTSERKSGFGAVPGEHALSSGDGFFLVALASPRPV